MLRNIIKQAYKRPSTMRVTDYYNMVDAAVRAIHMAILKGIVAIVLVITLIMAVAHSMAQSSGYYAPDYVDENGQIHDIDGDGSYYHWVQE